MQKNSLTVVYPPITTFTGYADTLAILCSYDEPKDWVFSHYIQIQVNDIINRVNNPSDLMMFAPFTSSFFCDFDTRKRANVVCDNIFLNGERCPFFNMFEIPNSYVNAIDNTFVDFIKRTINNQFYIYTYVDISKISNYNTNTELGHQILIFGYDDNEQVVNFADFFDGKYTFTKCKYNEIESAYKNIVNIFLPIVKSIALAQYVGYGAYTFDYSYVQDSIREYLYPNKRLIERHNNYTMSVFKPVNWQTETYMGVGVYDYFPKFINHELSLGKEKIDERLFHAMYDHKSMMIERIKYFIQKGYIDPEKSMYLGAYKNDVCDKTQIARNHIIKYNMKHDPNKLDSVANLLQKVRDSEIELLKHIYDV